MEEIAKILRVQKATAEVYVIDGVVAGAPIDMDNLLDEMNVSRPFFRAVERELERPGEITLRIIKDNLSAIDLTYNQIRCVIACLIRGHTRS